MSLYIRPHEWQKRWQEVLKFLISSHDSLIVIWNIILIGTQYVWLRLKFSQNDNAQSKKPDTVRGKYCLQFANNCPWAVTHVLLYWQVVIISYDSPDWCYSDWRCTVMTCNDLSMGYIKALDSKFYHRLRCGPTPRDPSYHWCRRARDGLPVPERTSENLCAMSWLLC